MSSSYYPEVGDVVRTRHKLYGHRRWGKVIAVSGAYIMVRLVYKQIEIEAYPVELELMKH